MKRLFMIFMLLFSLTLFGCNSDTPNEEPGITGYVMAKSGERVLVLDPVAKDFSSTGGISEFYNAIWFSNAPSNIEIGDKVKVWYDFLEESYPGQSEAKHVEKIPSYKPEGANLNESQALYNALTSQDIKGIPVVTSIKYDNLARKWHIEIKDMTSNEKLDITVDDK